MDDSKRLSNTIELKQKQSVVTETNINEARKVYIPIANRSTVLFFVTRDLATIEPMYQYSLQWFVNIFNTSIEDSEQSSNVIERLYALNNYMTYAIYCKVCASLLEKDKLMFAFLLSTRIITDLTLTIRDMQTHQAVQLRDGPDDPDDPDDPNPNPDPDPDVGRWAGRGCLASRAWRVNLIQSG